MTERDLNRIVNYYNELEHYINEYTRRFFISDIIKNHLLGLMDIIILTIGRLLMKIVFIS